MNRKDSVWYDDLEKRVFDIHDDDWNTHGDRITTQVLIAVVHELIEIKELLEKK